MTAAVPSFLTQDSDFSDRLNPFLVKELRQGLRSRVFVFGLLVLQSLLGILSLARLNESWIDGSDVDRFYWLSIGTVLHLLLPLGGIWKGDHDRLPGNWDLLVMTGRSAERIMLGKWITIVTQMALCWITVLPHQLLRYFSGGTNVVVEVVALTGFLINGLVFSLWGLLVASLSPAGRLILGLLMAPVVAIADVLSIVVVALSMDRTGQAEGPVIVGMIYLTTALISFGVTAGRYDYDMHQPRGIGHLYLSDQDRQLMDAESRASTTA